MKTTEEKNRMIAKFMGFKDLGNLVGGSPRVEKHVRGITYQSYPYSKLKYHTSWNWLMPVVEKIEDFHTINGVELEFQVVQCEDEIKIIAKHLNKPWEIIVEISADGSGKKENTYQAVCQFTEWYNENK